MVCNVRLRANNGHIALIPLLNLGASYGILRIAKEARLTPLFLFEILVGLTDVALCHKVCGGHLVPLLYILDLYLAKCDRSIAILVNFILHCLEVSHLICCELVSHVVKKRELANTMQDGVNELCIETRA